MVTTVAALVSSYIDAWNGDLERLLFATDDPSGVALVLEDFCDEKLARVADGIFYRSGVGVVAGLALVDGRQVVVKVHRWNVSIERLTGVQQVQRHQAESGLPAPMPLAGPTLLGAGIATAEEYRPGRWPDWPAQRTRECVAQGLFDFITSASALVGRVNVGAPGLLRPPTEPLWPEPHSIRFDFETSAPGAEWIDELGAEARRRAQAIQAPLAVGHLDWRVENLGFDDSAGLCAIYDWDAVGEAPEAVIVRTSAASFSSDMAHYDVCPLPSVGDMRAFVADYEHARHQPFTPAERELLDAANLYLVAYGARCQHSDRLLYPHLADVPGGGWEPLLRERGTRALS